MQPNIKKTKVNKYNKKSKQTNKIKKYLLNNYNYLEIIKANPKGLFNINNILGKSLITLLKLWP